MSGNLLHTEGISMKIKTYTTLPEEAKHIRLTVFWEEQGFVKEFDEVDSIAVHLVAFQDGQAVGTCRYYETETKGEYAIGRIAVLRTLRGQGLGGKLVREAEAQIKARGGNRTHIGAQVQAIPFYEKIGYTPVGDRYMDEHVPHQGMEKEL